MASYTDPCDDVLDRIGHARDTGYPSPLDTDPVGEFDFINIPQLAQLLTADSYEARICRESLIESLLDWIELRNDQNARDTLESILRLGN